MTLDTSQGVILSSVHELAVDAPVDPVFTYCEMQTTKTIAERLFQTREAMEVKAAVVCREIRCAQNRWSQYETGERRITLTVADRLCDKYGITLDWIYRGNPNQLPAKLRAELSRRMKETA